ncbi:MAG: hypothetical protein WCG25_01585 [bacterium]
MKIYFQSIGTDSHAKFIFEKFVLEVVLFQISFVVLFALGLINWTMIMININTIKTYLTIIFLPE